MGRTRSRDLSSPHLCGSSLTRASSNQRQVRLLADLGRALTVTDTRADERPRSSAPLDESLSSNLASTGSPGQLARPRPAPPLSGELTLSQATPRIQRQCGLKVSDRCQGLRGLRTSRAAGGCQRSLTCPDVVCPARARSLDNGSLTTPGAGSWERQGTFQWVLRLGALGGGPSERGCDTRSRGVVRYLGRQAVRPLAGRTGAKYGGLPVLRIFYPGAPDPRFTPPRDATPPTASGQRGF